MHGKTSMLTLESEHMVMVWTGGAWTNQSKQKGKLCF
jgi:hypothetical protein